MAEVRWRMVTRMARLVIMVTLVTPDSMSVRNCGNWPGSGSVAECHDGASLVTAAHRSDHKPHILFISAGSNPRPGDRLIKLESVMQ